MRYNSDMNEQILSDEQIEAEVSGLNVAWTHIPGEGLVRVFETQGFAEGLALVGRIGEVAERLQNYPEVTLRPDEVDVTVFAAEVGGVTLADIELAKTIDTEL
jgi:4a-hydroxytetrahydrobiopterin dehydratase